VTAIWFAANHGDLGGGEVMTLNLAEAARDLGYAVGIVAPGVPNRLVAEARESGFRTVEIHGRTPARYATNLRAWDLLERTGLLWANGLRPALATAGHRDRIVHVHQVPRGKQAIAVRAAAVGARAAVVPSEFAASTIPGSVVLPNWTRPWSEPDFNRRLVNCSDLSPVVLGFLGRLSVLKGVAVLAEALALLDRQDPGRYRLLLAGEPTYATSDDRAEVETALAPVAHLVSRTGWMAPRDFFKAVDLAVFPSVIAESFGLVAAEAMSSGCPFVVSNSGALPEVAGDHPYVSDPDARSLANTLEAAVATYSEGLLRGSYNRWVTHYSPSAGRAGLKRLLDGWGWRREPVPD